MPTCKAESQHTGARARLCLLVSLFLLGGCGGAEQQWIDNAPPPDPGPPHHGGEITVGYIGETNSWLPSRGTFFPSGINAAVAVYDALVMRDHEMNLRPYLAESIEPNGDYTVWTLRLRPGVRFHDGTPLNAEALKWNFDNLHKQQGSATYGMIRDVVKVEVVDDLTVRYHLARGIAPFPDLLTGPFGWPFSPTAATRLGDDAGSNPVGTGPFRFVSWRRDDRLVLERNEDYWRDGLPYLDRIVFRPLPDEDTRLASLVSGDVDAVQTMRQPTVDRLRSLPDIHRHEFIGNNGGASLLNVRVPPADDVRVRRALAFALEQESLIEVLGGAGITPRQTQFFNASSPWYSERVAEVYPEGDLEKAVELLKAYQADPARSDGKAPGDPVVVEFLCLPYASVMEVSQIYQAFWSAAGFHVELQQVEQATQIQRIISGEYMITCGRAGDQSDPYLTLSNWFGPPDVQPLNFTNFQHPVIDEALEVLRLETAFEPRYAAVERVMLLLAEEVPLLWNSASVVAFGVDPDVRNLAGWRFPDGTPGDGFPEGRVMWGQVWRAAGE